MNDKRFSILGPESSLAGEYPEVAKLLSMSGKNLSRICYGVISLYVRCLGFIPETKEDVKEFANIIEVLNSHQAKPWLITSSSTLPFAGTEATDFLTEDSIGWDDPAMEAELM